MSIWYHIDHVAELLWLVVTCPINMYTHPHRFILQCVCFENNNNCINNKVKIILIPTNMLLSLSMSYVVLSVNLATIQLFSKFSQPLCSKRFWNRNINSYINCKSVLRKLNPNPFYFKLCQTLLKQHQMLSNCSQTVPTIQFWRSSAHFFCTLMWQFHTVWELHSEEP